MKMTDEEFEEIIKNIEWRRPYVEKYYKIFNSKPQWIKDDEEDFIRGTINIPDFEEWLVAEIRDEKINNLLNEED